MADDQLTRQQQQRIDDAHADRLAPWLARNAGGAEGEDLGIVVSHFRKEVEVEPLARPGERLRCFLRATTGAVVTGDRVLMEADPENPNRGVIVARLPRHSLLSRHVERGERPVCANLDCLLVTIAPEPAPHVDLIDRYLVAAHIDGIRTLLVLNKADLTATGARAELDGLLELYRRLQVPVIVTSARSGQGLAELRSSLQGAAAALVGQSGVGKSSLINALLPAAGAEVGELSRKRNRGSGRGRHTTTTSRLYRLDDGLIIDSPGIREFTPGIPDLATLIGGFPEIAQVADDCRFRDCRHEREPDCAVQTALAQGRIDSRRWQSFRQLRAQLEGT